MRRRPWDVVLELLTVLLLLPALVALAESLTPAGLEAYRNWWLERRGWGMLAQSLQLAALSATFATVLAAVFVSAVVRLPKRPAIFASLLTCLPMLIPSSLLATVWIVALGKQGLLTRWGIHVNPYCLPAAATALAMRYAGLAVIVLLLERFRQLRTAPAERVFLTSRVGRFRLRWGVTIRAMLVGWLLVALFSVNDHVLPEMLLISTYGTQILLQYQAYMDITGAAALSVPLAGIGVILLAATLGLLRRRTVVPEEGDAQYLLRGGRVWATGVIVVVLGLLLAGPIYVLACRVGDSRLLVDVAGEARREIGQTILLAGLAGLICASAGAFLAGHWLRCRRQNRRTLAPLVLVNLALPPSLLAIGWIELTSSPSLRWLGEGDGPILLAYATRFVPVATLLLYAAWSRESSHPRVAARVHGVSTRRTIWNVTFPARRMTLATGALLCFLLVATELDVSVLLAAPGRSTLGVRLYSMIHTAPAAWVAALSLDILMFVAPVMALLVPAGSRLWKKNKMNG
jgi:iron(III) transport system permease protein